MMGISMDSVLRISVRVSDSRVYLTTTFNVKSDGSRGALNISVHSRLAPGRIFPMARISSTVPSTSRFHETVPCA